MAGKTFKCKLTSEGPGGAWTFMKIPFSVEKVWGTRARLSVQGSINGFAFRSSIFPLGNGTHSMMVNKAMRAGAKTKPGDTVKVVMEPDTAPRVVTVPAELKKAFAKNKVAKTAFEKMPYSHKKGIRGVHRRGQTVGDARAARGQSPANDGRVGEEEALSQARKARRRNDASDTTQVSWGSGSRSECAVGGGESVCVGE